MLFEGLPDRREGPVHVVGNELAARQWELATSASTRADAWISPHFVTFLSWLRRIASRDQEAAPVVNSMQHEALWRRIVDDSAAELALIDSRGPAAWAADADLLLAHWRIDPAGLTAAREDSDFAIFLRWRTSYRERLIAAGWRDDTDLLRAVEALPPGPAATAEWLDQRDPTPAECAWRARIESSGWQVFDRGAPAGAGRAHRLALPDRTAELDTAARWLCRRIALAPVGRAALVVPDLDTCRREVERSVRHAADRAGVAVWLQNSRTLDGEPAIGAALAALRLLSSHGGFEQLSHWLRSPYFHRDSPAQAGAAARFECSLRDALPSQVRFRDTTARRLILRRLTATDEALGARLARAVQAIGRLTTLRTPTEWAERWEATLRELGWPAADAGVPERVLRAWEAAVGDFNALTPILGTVSVDAALIELGALLARRRVTGVLPARGLHIFGTMEAVGPGYDAVWVTGMKDRAWPRAPRLNPLLPRRLQVEHGMPGATPDSAYELAGTMTRALIARTDDTVFSWPAHVDEQPAQPSALITGVATTDVAALGIDIETRDARVSTRGQETFEDPVPPFAGGRIRGGTHTLNLQARAPLVAFLSSRLHAQPIEPLARGLPLRRFGSAAHRALQLIGEGRADRDAWCALAASNHRATLEAAVDTALAPMFAGVSATLAGLYRLERERLLTVIGRLLEHESRRPPFAIESLEQRALVGFSRSELAGRIDRVDRLGDGRLAVIDYKTGRATGAAAWFSERLGDTQLPLYAVELGPQVAAAVIISLHQGNVAYSGCWDDDAAFPARGMRLPDARDWPAQLARWHEQLEQLVMEFEAGDGRLFAGELAAAEGAYSPLTRVREHAARLEAPQ